MQTEKLSIDLPADMVRMIRRRVASGAYASNSEVIREALRFWQSRDQEQEVRLQALCAEINEAAEDPERITDDEMRKHFEKRLAEVEKTRGS